VSQVKVSKEKEQGQERDKIKENMVHKIQILKIQAQEKKAGHFLQKIGRN
jgi:hypothetical protein